MAQKSFKPGTPVEFRDRNGHAVLFANGAVGRSLKKVSQ